eukprot:scaffold2_cov94-Skeletonema_dohrnii-CCMP3373.AAC.1
MSMSATLVIHCGIKSSPSPHLSGQSLPSLFFKNCRLERETSARTTSYLLIGDGETTTQAKYLISRRG